MATLFLVGMMGAGKSTVGRLVAEALGRAFVDLDEAVAVAAGRAPGEIFSAEGEAGFRRWEAAALEAVAASGAVVACGGGVVLGPANVSLMRRHGMVVWLEAPVAALEARVGSGEGRPLLAGGGASALGPLLAERAAAYAAAAHARVATGGRAPAEVAAEVVEQWNDFS